MENLEVVTELRLRREAAEEPLRRELVAKLQLSCRVQTSLDERRLLGWETREHEPCEPHAQALRVWFGVESIGELGLGHSPQAARNWTWATKAERRREVERRKLLKDGVKVLGAALLPVGSLTAAAQRLGGRPSLDLAAVEAAEQVATHLASEYLAAPNGETVAAAIAHARTLTDRLRHASLTPRIRTRLAAVASDAASLAGESAFHVGLGGETGVWFDRAIALAREAGDRRLEALALAAPAWTISASASPKPGIGDRHDALAAVEAAAELDGHLPPAGRAWVNGLLARELAGAGDDQGSGHALERALEAVARVGRDEPGWGWWSEHANLSGWDGARARVYTGLRPLYLGRYREAVPILEGALDGTVVPHRRATLHTDLAMAWAGLDDPDRASASGIAALDEASTHGLASFFDELRLIRAGFPSDWADLDCMRELDDRLAAA